MVIFLCRRLFYRAVVCLVSVTKNKLFNGDLTSSLAKNKNNKNTDDDMTP